MNYDQDLKLRLSETLPPGTKKGIYNNRKYRHILPLFDDDRQITKREAIRKYTGIDILPELLPESEYHRDIHHLTSSQLLCYNVFSRLINSGETNGDMVRLFEKLNNRLGIHLFISSGQKCAFEYNDRMCWKDNILEGTKFDFHISGSGTEQEIFIETKFTEGFGKAKVHEGDYHFEKAEFYKRELNNIVGRKDSKPLTTDDVFENYQIFRNILRANEANSAVVFIFDGACAKSVSGLRQFNSRFSIDGSKHVVFLTWQDVRECWPTGVEMPFQFNCIK